MIKKILLAIIILIAAMAAFLLWYKVIRIPDYAKEYFVSPSSCSYQKNVCTDIGFSFIPAGKAKNQIPQYVIQEFPEQGRTKVVFYNTSYTEKQFSYDDIVNNPLIEKLNYYQENGNLVIDIARKGDFLPAEISENGNSATIVLKEGGEDYPKIFDQKPADNSAAWPAFRVISFKAELKDSLKKTVILFQGQPVEPFISEISPNNYYFTFKENLEKDTVYTVKIILTDAKDRTNIASWIFEGRILIETTLGKDRFKYLGWWGEINTNGVSVREKPETSAKLLGTFSSMNRVKVLSEVYGETVNDNGLWYQIDGGHFPKAYVFSEYVTPTAQPEPPKDFKIPKEVKQGESWIDVDLTKKILTLFDYDKPVFSTYTALGREENQTEEGTFRIWYKLKKDDMQGGPPLHEYKYDLKDIPNVMYYYESYAIHGTYWHDRFGTLQSAGCTNLTQGDAAYIFENTNPKLNDSETETFSSSANNGTVVYNHR